MGGREGYYTDMIALQIENIKEFMTHLFQGDMFDRFHVKNCEVTTFVTWQVGGERQEEWYDTGEKPEDGTGCVLWTELKPYVLEWIRGKKTPGKIKIDFCHYMANGDVGSLRIQYERETLLLYTGYMQKEFSLNRTEGQEWDENCKEFMQKNEIVSTQLS